MFIGHYSAALVLKKFDKKTSLGSYFIAVQLVDIFWCVFVFFGIEKVRLVPGFTESNSLDAYFMPYTHSLVASFLWALAAGIFLVKFRKAGILSAILISIAVFSHFILDYIVHVPDLPISFGESAKIGLGLWKNKPIAFAIEALLLFIGFAFYGIKNKWSRVFLLVLTMLVVSSYSMPTPPGTLQLSLTMLGSFFGLALLAHKVDKVR